VRRLKTYTASSGYVYHYFYEGRRDFHNAGDAGAEYVFSVSADRKNWLTVSVQLGDGPLRAWAVSHARDLTSTERYAIAKMALFQAFDERATPAQMKDVVRLRNADVEAFVETLGL